MAEKNRWQKWSISRTWRQLFQNSDFPCVILICLKCEFHKSSYFIIRSAILEIDLKMRVAKPLFS